MLTVFTVGAVANAGRAMLMRISGMSTSNYTGRRLIRPYIGQRIVARLRERMYEASLRQEVEFVEKGEGDVLSRLSADSSIVGERYVSIISGPSFVIHLPTVLPKIFRMVSGHLSWPQLDVSCLLAASFSAG
jgi:hypothetical protein